MRKYSGFRQSLVISLVLLALSTLLLAASFGAVTISPDKVLSALLFKDSSLTSTIVVDLRMPRILLAFTTGAGLALTGAVLQLITRNPLADPYLFGISSGACFGAVLVTVLGSSFINTKNDAFIIFFKYLQHLSLPIGAFIGALLSVLLVFSLSCRSNNQVERMLLSGVATSFMFSAFASLLLYFSTPQTTTALLFWTLGSFSQASWDSLWLPISVVFLSLMIFLGMKRWLLALQSGDETAHTLGIKVPRLRLTVLILCSLVTATLVAFAGGIGFVGLMIPHAVRQLCLGKQPLVLITLIGGIFMVWVDVLARSLLNNQELPVGIITAALGSVFFLYTTSRY